LYDLLHSASEFLFAHIPKLEPRVHSGLAGPNFGATHVCATSRSPSLPTARHGQAYTTQNSSRETLPDSAEHNFQPVFGFPQWIPNKPLLANSFPQVRLQPRFHRFASTHASDGAVSTRALCFPLERPSLAYRGHLPSHPVCRPRPALKGP
jgi:hypothetical protein